MTDVSTTVRYYITCTQCKLQPMFFSQGHETLTEAEAAALAHQERHKSLPYCICDTVPEFVMLDDDDDYEPSDGHSHCRHSGRCCSCHCMTKTKNPDV